MKKELQQYIKKRDFNKTSEPKDFEIKGDGDKLSFVIQKHQASHLHYDLRLELNGTMKSWAVPKGPSLNPQDKRLAMMVEDHPIDYQNFEGIIPEGNYGAGTVMIWDRGKYHSASSPLKKESEKRIAQGLEKGNFGFVLEGEKLKGEFALVKLRRPGAKNSWLLIKKNDRYASRKNILSEDRSSATGKSMEEIAGNNSIEIDENNLNGAKKTPMPKTIQPMLSTLIKEPFSKEGWLFEIKWDGYRAISFIKDGEVKIISRNKLLLTEKFPKAVEALKKIPAEVVLDGEMVVLDNNGRSNFQLLQNYIRMKEGNLIYYVFDILYFNGYSLLNLPLIERKKILAKIIHNDSLIRVSGYIENEGEKFFELIKKNNIEGMLAKKADSFYWPGIRSKDWLKIKNHLEQEAVIGGFTEPSGSRKYFGALVLGVYKNGKLKYIGHAGGGFDEDQLKFIYSKLKPLIVEKSHFDKVLKTNAKATWVKPELVAQIRFSEWTDEGFLRQPIFLGLREDKKAREVKRE